MLQFFCAVSFISPPLPEDIQQLCWRSLSMACRRYIQ